MSFPCRIFLLTLLLAACCGGVWSQSANNGKEVFTKPGEQDTDDGPKGFKETLDKMRIEKEKKDFKEMIDRGDEALKLSDELKHSFEQNGKLSESDLARLSKVEKLVKKIREELGGRDDNDQENDEKEIRPQSLADAVGTLRSSAVTLFDELKKTSRFTISAAAINSSNNVLKLARFLRFGH